MKNSAVNVKPGEKAPSLYVEVSDISLTAHVTGGLIAGPF